MSKSEAEGAEPAAEAAEPPAGEGAAAGDVEDGDGPEREDLERRPEDEGRRLEEDAAGELVAELEELRDRHLRLAAEFDNYRRRTRQELLKTRELGQAELTRRLLEPLDDLRRVAETTGEEAGLDALHEGVALVERKLVKELREAGLEPIDPLGKRFDPNEHEALSSVPTEDPEQDEVVVDVFLRGYRFGERLLRPARVAVGSYRPEEAEDASDAEGEDDRG